MPSKEKVELHVSLENVVKSYVEHDENCKGISDDIAEILERKIIDDIKSKIINDYAHKYAERKAIEYRVNELKPLLIDGIIIAFLMGIAVNQFTEILTGLKSCFPDSYTFGITLFLSLLAVGICVIIYINKFIVASLKIINDKKRGSSDENN